MKFLVAALVLTFTSLPALACFDPNAKAIGAKDAIKAFQASASFNTCMNKLKKVGFRVSKANAWRTDREAGSASPVIYTLLFQGPDRKNKQVRLKMSYELTKPQGFRCEEISYAIPRGC